MKWPGNPVQDGLIILRKKRFQCFGCSYGLPNRRSRQFCLFYGVQTGCECQLVPASRAGPTNVGAPGRLIISRPLKMISFIKLYRRNFLSAHAQIAENFLGNSFARGNLSLIEEYFQIFQWRRSAPGSSYFGPPGVLPRPRKLTDLQLVTRLRTDGARPPHPYACLGLGAELSAPAACPSFFIVFIQSVVCLPKPVLHTVRSSASSFNSQHPLLILRSFSSCLRLLLRLPATSFYPSFNKVF